MQRVLKAKVESPEFLARKEMSESVKLEEMVNLDCQDEMVKREMTDNPDNLDPKERVEYPEFLA